MIMNKIEIGPRIIDSITEFGIFWRRTINGRAWEFGWHFATATETAVLSAAPADGSDDPTDGHWIEL
jgi:hypothetical protein